MDIPIIFDNFHKTFFLGKRRVMSEQLKLKLFVLS